jgi:hypothetical protein
LRASLFFALVSSAVVFPLGIGFIVAIGSEFVRVEITFNRASNIVVTAVLEILT